MGIGFSAKSFQLLEGLRDNCNRKWYLEHKLEILEHCVDPFAFLLDCLTPELSDHSIRLSGGKQTMFRLNRDVRFSKDKSPYNHHISGTLTRSGSKNEQGGLVYLRLDPTGGRIGAGYWGLKAKRMGAIRDRILTEPDAFQDLVDHLAKADLELNITESVKSMPRGYSQYADHNFAWALRMKHFSVSRPMKRNEWKGNSIVELIADFARTVTPLLDFGLVSVEKFR